MREFLAPARGYRTVSLLNTKHLPCRFFSLFSLFYPALSLSAPCLRCAGEGLPFDVSSLRVTAHMCLTAPLGARPRDRRVRLDAVVGRLGLDRTVALYVRAIAGTRFDASKDLLTISVDKHEQAGLNRREALEQLVGLVSEAERLKGQFGAFPAVTHLPRYS